MLRAYIRVKAVPTISNVGQESPWAQLGREVQQFAGNLDGEVHD